MSYLIVERHQDLPPVAMPMLPIKSVDWGGKLVPLWLDHCSPYWAAKSDVPQEC